MTATNASPVSKLLCSHIKTTTLRLHPLATCSVADACGAARVFLPYNQYNQHSVSEADEMTTDAPTSHEKEWLNIASLGWHKVSHFLSGLAVRENSLSESNNMKYPGLPEAL